MNQHLAARTLATQYSMRDLNEADTRAKVIDVVLEDVLDWPKSSIGRETTVYPGYADYVLSTAGGHVALVIEAKREGIYFELPKRDGKIASRPEYISVRSLLTDEPIRDAIHQVREYASNMGCPFAGITNGHEWIFFRVFEAGIDWRTLRAYTVPSLTAIDTAFTEFFNALSYRCVVHDGSLHTLLSRTSLDNRETYRPGHEIPAYTRVIQSNRYVQYIRPIAETFFGTIERDQTELMNACYVSNSSFDSAFSSAEAVLTDSLTPFLETYNIRDTRADDGGGSFGNRIEKTLIREPKADVLVLFGGKGIGKSTFLRRLLFVRPPQVLRKNAVTALIDLLKTQENRDEIDQKIWSELHAQLDVDRILSADRTKLLELFSDRFDVASRQELFGLPEDSIEYHRALNSLLSDWKRDSAYVAIRLASHLKRRHKGVVVVIDNTDQYPSLQEYCFTRAQQIADTLKCLVIISMREERFYASSIRGVLDAFQNSGFHLSSPSPENVFAKRLEYVQHLLADEHRRWEFLPLETPPQVVDTIRALLRSFYGEFRTPGSHLANFLSACAHGNIRLALELFRGMIQSRYTNIDEITNVQNWTWQLHQVLKPVMIPNRFFYEESESHVPNVFQVRSKKRGSHFTSLRLLKALFDYAEIQGQAFFPLASLSTELSNRFHMEEDVRVSLDVLLKFGLIEASNRLDQFSEEIDAIRVTAYGRHVFSNLVGAFTYLDLVSTDTALFESRVSAELATLGMAEYELWERSYTDGKARVERVEKRIKKTVEFFEYLEREEEREASLYGLAAAERFTPRLRLALDDEVQKVRRSANKQRYRDR